MLGILIVANNPSAVTRFAARFATPAVRWLALLGLCAAYLQGGFNKATDFPGAIAEMQHFGLSPERPFALAVIALELVASVMILTGIGRWLGALALAAFTLMATVLALRFWEMAPPARFMAANSFFEHLGLVGGFLLVAWHDLHERAATGRPA
ncbi:MAG: DoxX family protein [Hyphomicrobiales bacterium]|nr:MAG: DoxX family protein [Hyphomicrobiales bacterium]